MNVSQHHSGRIVPRFSLLTAFLLLTIVGLAIVVVQFWREIGPQRQELQRLRNEVGNLTIEDPKRFHAIEARTNKDWSWRWRVWVPAGQNVAVKLSFDAVLRDGFPSDALSINLEPGENWIALDVHHDPLEDKWEYNFATPDARSRDFVIKDSHAWMTWVRFQPQAEGIGYETVALPQNEPRYLLKRYRVSRQTDPNPTVSKEPLPGFIIWLERQ